jgi:hypothetical protein
MTIVMLARWIESHGFRCYSDIGNGVVHVFIPMTLEGKPAGSELMPVRNMNEARKALGY